MRILPYYYTLLMGFLSGCAGYWYRDDLTTAIILTVVVAIMIPIVTRYSVIMGRLEEIEEMKKHNP